MKRAILAILALAVIAMLAGSSMAQEQKKPTDKEIKQQIAQLKTIKNVVKSTIDRLSDPFAKKELTFMTQNCEEDFDTSSQNENSIEKLGAIKLQQECFEMTLRHPYVNDIAIEELLKALNSQK